MFYLQDWIHQIVGSVLGRTRVTRAEIEEYQLLRLRETLRYSYDRSSFYRKLFDDAGIFPGDVHSLADLSRIPLTEPHHLSESPYRFLCISQSEVARPYSFVTSGTTGPQKKVFWSLGDLERIIEFMAAGIATVAVPGDVVQVMLADGRPYSQADLLFRGVKKIGATPVLAAMDAEPEEMLRIIQSRHTTILFGYTGRLIRMTRELNQKEDLRSTGIKTLFLAGEYLPETMRRELKRIWQCRVRTHYGLTEMGLGVAVECAANDGYHFNEAGLLLEIVDPETGKGVSPGQQGELVFTTLLREAMPLIRYRTHDLTRIIPGPCACGAGSLLKFDAVRKRLESIVTLGAGEPIDSSMFDDALFEVQGLLDYQLLLSREEGKERLELIAELLIERREAKAELHSQLLSIPAVQKSIAAGKMAEPTVQLAGRGALKALGREKKMIVRR